MGSRYPWRVINPTNRSHALILGFSLLWKCSLNCAKGSALTLLAQAWLCSGRGRSRKAHPACPPVSLSAPLDTHRAGLRSSAWTNTKLGEQQGRSKSKIRRKEVPCRRADGAEPMEVGCPRPLRWEPGSLPQLWQCLCPRSLTQTRTLPTLGVFDLPEILVFIRLFGLCDCALLQKRMSAFQGGCGGIQAYGKPFSSNKIAEFSQNCPDLFAIMLHHTQSLSNSGSFHSSASYLFIVLLLWLHSFPYEET